MRILIINISCDETSVGRICVDTANEAINRGDMAVIAYGRGKVSKRYAGNAYKICSKADVLWHVIITRLYDRHGFGCKQATKRFVDWIKEYDPDRIYLHNIHGYYINIEVLFNYLRECNKEIIWTLHDCWSFTGHCAHYIGLKCDGWRSGCGTNCPGKNEYPKTIGSKKIAFNYQKKRILFTGIDNLSIIVPCQWLSDQLKGSFMKDYPVKVVHNEVSKNVYKPTASDYKEKLGIEGKKIILAVASVWTEAKGLNDLIALRSMLDDGCCIVLVGVNKIQEKKLCDKFVCIRRIENKENLAKLYTMSDYFVNLTHADTFPTVNLEARACGTTVITYDVGGCRETIGEEDYLIDEGAVDLVAKIINGDSRNMHSEC